MSKGGVGFILRFDLYGVGYGVSRNWFVAFFENDISSMLSLLFYISIDTRLSLTAMNPLPLPLEGFGTSIEGLVKRLTFRMLGKLVSAICVMNLPCFVEEKVKDDDCCC